MTLSDTATSLWPIQNVILATRSMPTYLSNVSRPTGRDWSTPRYDQAAPKVLPLIHSSHGHPLTPAGSYMAVGFELFVIHSRCAV